MSESQKTISIALNPEATPEDLPDDYAIILVAFYHLKNTRKKVDATNPECSADLDRAEALIGARFEALQQARAKEESK